MPIKVTEIDARLKKALKIEDRDRKIAYIMSLSQYILMDMQMEQADKGLSLPAPETPPQP